MQVFRFEAKSGGISVRHLLTGVLAAFIITALAFVLFSLLIAYSAFPESAIKTVAFSVVVLSLFAAGFLVARKARSRGLVCGLLTGALYMAIFYLLTSLSFGSFGVNFKSFIMLFLSLVSSGAGGIVGINTVKKGNKYI